MLCAMEKKKRKRRARIRRVSLDADVWGELPFEMVERVLSFLPVPDLCRFRTVSKESNALIRKRQFGATHGHNALRCRDASSFIVMRITHTFSRAERDGELSDSDLSDVEVSYEYTHQTWCFFDLEARRWYTLKDHHPQTIFSADVGVDDGLVCRFFKTQAHPGFSLIVFNPIADTLREIPNLPAHVAPDFVEVNLIVDSAAQNFRVLIINQRICEPTFQGGHRGRLRYIKHPLVSIFDSATSEWRSLSNPPRLSSEWEDLSWSIVMFQGLVYAFFAQGENGFRADFYLGLWRCSPVENAWERVHSVNMYTGNSIFDHVDMDISIFGDVDKNIVLSLSAPMLFASADRLFMMAWITDLEVDSVPNMLKVTEIRASGMALETLFVMTESEVMDVFDVNIDDLEVGVRRRSPPNIQASACGNSLLFTSLSNGKLMVLDLETLECKPVPQIPVEASQRNEICIFHGKYMNLILPSTLWWQDG